MLYAVICRLGRPAADYPMLSGAIQSVSVASWPVNDATWLVESEQPAATVRDAVAAAVEAEDLALVFPLDVMPAVWTSLARQRYGRRFLESALARSRAGAA
jgi:hypothetical protein